MPGDELRLRLNSSAYANLANADVCVLSSGMSVISCYITYVYLCILMLSQVICPVKKNQGDRMECSGTRVQDHGQ